MATTENVSEEEDQEMYEHYNLTVDSGQQLLRVDKFLSSKLPRISRNRLQNAAKNDCILVNKKAVKSNYKVHPGDEVSVVMPYEKEDYTPTAENIPLQIVYEDDDVVVIEKEAGMVVHPGFGNRTGTLVNALLHHFDNLPQQKDNNQRPGLIHRLDKDTTGLMVIAKTEQAMTVLAKQFFNRTIEREYTALVWGQPEEEKGTIIGHVGRSTKDRKIYTVTEDETQGKHAVTHYHVVEGMHYVSLIKCKLETGRTHQIRVHLKHIGHTLFGDQSYGGDKALKGTTFGKYKQFLQNCFETLPRQALHASSLGFTHPITGKELFFTSPLPEDMRTVVDKWKIYLGGNE